jgi:K+ transporter
LGLVIGALGVVFGDIGTSPIYTVQTIFNPNDPHPVPISTENIYGVVSLIFWAVMIIVTLTYVTLVMRADNGGEGGIMALIAQVRRLGSRGGRTALALAALGLFGAALFSGDSVITPAISVLSAVEGLKVIQPGLEGWIVPITAVIIAALFAVQRRGTGAVGGLFGPVMIAWFTAIGACGVYGIVDHPEIVKALSPVYALKFVNVEYNNTIHEHVVILTIETLPVPRLADFARIEVDELGYAEDGIIHVTARFGYMESPNVPDTLRLLKPTQTEGPIAIDDVLFALSKIELTMGDAPTMAAWRKRLFIATSYITADAVEFFGLPPERTVIVGARIEV